MWRWRPIGLENIMYDNGKGILARAKERGNSKVEKDTPHINTLEMKERRRAHRKVIVT